MELQSLLLLEEYDFRYTMGVALRVDTVTIADKKEVISAIAKHFAVFEIKAELDQLLCGLSCTIGALDLLRNNPAVMRPLLVPSITGPLSADEMFDAFDICYSPDGSNIKEREETTVML